MVWPRKRVKNSMPLYIIGLWEVKRQMVLLCSTSLSTSGEENTYNAEREQAEADLLPSYGSGQVDNG